MRVITTTTTEPSNAVRVDNRNMELSRSSFIARQCVCVCAVPVFGRHWARAAVFSVVNRRTLPVFGV